MWQYQNTDELYHHGILGQKWGVRKRDYEYKHELTSSKEIVDFINNEYNSKKETLLKKSKRATNIMSGASGAALFGSIFINSAFLPVAGALVLGSASVKPLSKLGEFFIEKNRVTKVVPYEFDSILEELDKI